MVLEGMGIDGEGALIGGDEVEAEVLVGAGGFEAGGDAEAVVLVGEADGVVEVEAVIGGGDGGGPEVGAEGGVGSHEGAADEVPVEEVIGLEEREDAAEDAAEGFEFAGADGVPGVLMTPDERVGEVTAVDGVAMEEGLRAHGFKLAWGGEGEMGHGTQGKWEGIMGTES